MVSTGGTFTRLGGAFVVAALLAAPGVASAASADFVVETVADGLDHPWSIAFLPDGGLLVTELTGQLRVIRDGAVTEEPVSGTPEVAFGGQGGLSDVELHPDFAENRLVYLTWSADTPEGRTLRVGRGEFTGSALENFEVIFEADAYRATAVHYGAKLAFLGDGTMMVTSGDGFDYREDAQRTSNHFGAYLHLNDDGSAAAGNPFADEEGAKPEIWSIGHRNPQAVVVDPVTGIIYGNEHGPRGGDEINVIEKGANYGWPLATYGMDYSGAYVSPYTEYEGTKQPLLQWTPSIAPSSMAIYRGEAFPAWDGDLLVTALAEMTLRRVDLEDGEFAGQEVLMGTAFADKAEGEADGERLRDVAVAPDGTVYVLTDGEGGKVLRLVPGTDLPTASVPAE